MSWLITREAAEAEADCALLARRGVPARAAPCVAFEALSWPRWTAASGLPVTLLSSRQAARCWLAQPDRAGLVAAMAPSTAELLREARIAPAVVAEGGAAALARAVRGAWEAAGRPAWHLRWPTSDVALAAPEQAEALEALAPVGPVQREAVYRTGAPAGLQRALAALVAEGWSAAFSSPSAVKAFLAHLPDAAPAPRHVACLGRSTARAWDAGRRPGWAPASLATSLLDTVVTLENQP